jgi:hypothetical protein
VRTVFSKQEHTGNDEKPDQHKTRPRPQKAALLLILVFRMFMHRH